MKTFLNKAKTWLKSIQKNIKVPIKNMHGAIKIVIVGFLVVVFILVMTIYAAWFWLCWQGKAALNELIQLLDRVISPQMVAFITFIATAFVDKDNDGIPDKFEKEKTDDTH